MKLQDFRQSAAFEALRQQMGAEYKELVRSAWGAFDADQLLRSLASREGVAVNVSEIVFAANGTLEYQGQKVLVYIRDQRTDIRRGRKGGEYKYHVANCRTLREAFAGRRENRYVVSRRTDGIFLINLLSGNAVVEQNIYRQMHICKNCLQELEYGGYISHRGAKEDRIYRGFQLEDFFRKYGGTPVTRVPRHTDGTAPLNVYADDFSKRADAYKEWRHWRCEKCGIDLAETHHLLHAHHRDGDKSNNDSSNLQALCVACHSDQPDHSQLKYSPDYRELLVQRGSRR